MGEDFATETYLEIELFRTCEREENVRQSVDPWSCHS